MSNSKQSSANTVSSTHPTPQPTVNDSNISNAEELEDELDDLKPDDLSETIKKEKANNNSIAIFAPKPKNATFDSQMKKEEIVLLLRRHPITQLSKVGIVLFGLLFPIVLFASPFLSFLPFNYKIATVVGWYLIVSGFALESFLVWYFRVFIITNKRAIDIDYYSMVSKDITTAELMRIQDMSVVSSGVLASIIDMGTLYLQTAGQNFNPARMHAEADAARSTGIEFEDIPQPSKVKKIVTELISTKRKKYARLRRQTK